MDKLHTYVVESMFNTFVPDTLIPVKCVEEPKKKLWISLYKVNVSCVFIRNLLCRVMSTALYIALTYVRHKIISYNKYKRMVFGL